MTGSDSTTDNLLPTQKPSYWDQFIGWCIPILTMMGGLMMPLFGIHFKHFDVGLAFLNAYPVIASYLTILCVIALIVEINGIHDARTQKGWKSGKFWDRLGVFLFKGLPLAVGSGVFLYALRFLPKDANGLVSFALPAHSTLGALLLTAQVLLIVAFAFDTAYCAYKAIWYHGKSSALSKDDPQAELYRAKIGKYVSRGLSSGTTLGALVLIFFFNTIPPFAAVITALAITCAVLAFVAWRCERSVQEVEKNLKKVDALNNYISVKDATHNPQNGHQTTPKVIQQLVHSEKDTDNLTNENNMNNHPEPTLQSGDSTWSLKSTDFGTPSSSEENLSQVGSNESTITDGQTEQTSQSPNAT